MEVVVEALENESVCEANVDAEEEEHNTAEADYGRHVKIPISFLSVGEEQRSQVWALVDTGDLSS